MKKIKFKTKSIKKLGVIFFLGILLLSVQHTSAQGVNAPEASGFEPVSATDMVNLSSGDMAYVLPLIEIDGFPVTLSYHAGIPMEMESSWIGLGWNINTGTIARGIVGTPDDWNDGKLMNLTFLYFETESYTVNVGVGIAKAAEVGVGLSWGSNKSLSGSVSATIGPLSASIDTNGNYNIGVSTSGKFKGAFGEITDVATSNGTKYGGSLSFSNNGGFSIGAKGGASYNGVSASLGVSLSGNGIGSSFSIGGGNNTGKTGTSGSGSTSVGSFSAGDFNIASSGFYLPINIGIFNFGFGYTKQKIELKKRYSKHGFGALYHNNNSLYNSTLGEKNTIYHDAINTFSDYQRRNHYGDIYEQFLPQFEKDFISDYRLAKEKLNFSFVGYDSYNINASGISGNIKPLIGENTVLIGEGFEEKSSRLNSGKRMKGFYHNSKKNGTNLLKPSKSLSGNSLHFSFSGHTTQDVLVSGNINGNQNLTNNLNINDFVSKGGNVTSRIKSGSFIEVFTNAQIDASNSSNILVPASLYKGKESLPDTRASKGYVASGIGGYKITTPDGKTYHFSQPVYHYEQIQHNYLEPEGQNKSPYNSNSKREATPYATHWLLTAITGPDYIDDGDNFPDKEDLGYWVRLDYGQWSNAYTWRSPYDSNIAGNIGSIDGLKNYSTYSDQGINKADPGYFLQGRKDLYYLDKIVSKNNIAYFVKDIRKDGLGTNADYKFDPGQNESSTETLHGESYVNYKENAKYETEYQLRLDKIIIENRTNKSPILNTTGGSILSGIVSATQTNRYLPNGYFDINLPTESKVHKLHQANNVIDVGDFTNYDYSRASKVIKFEQDYSLAKNSPNSEVNPNNSSKKLGKLSLLSVKNYGRGMVNGATENQLFDYMPPYLFSYKRSDKEYERDIAVEITPPYPQKKYYEYIRANKDSWGFIEGNENGLSDNDPNRKTLADSWSLNKITTPQGSSISINYEEDDFYVEAFSRRYWQNSRGLEFKPIVINGNSNEFILEVTNNGVLNSNFHVEDFSDYFKINDDVFIDLWLCHRHQQDFLTNNTEKRVDISPNIPGYKVKVINVTSSKLTLRCNIQGSTNLNLHSTTNYSIGVTDGNAPGDGGGANIYYDDKIRGECPPDTNSQYNRLAMKYKLLATKSPLGNSGGGLKVKEIIVEDELNNEYITEYDYRVPNTITNQLTDRSSGITSFYPVYGETFVPYQNELPGPGVMYEWVTMKAYGIDKTKPLGQQKVLNTYMRYNFHTLQANFDIFKPDFAMKDKDGDDIFSAKITDYFINNGNVTAKKISIEKNLSKIGQLISVEELNSHNQSLTKTINNYVPKIGTEQETFSSMKSIYDYDYDNSNGNFSNPVLYKRLLSVSTKKEKVSVLKSVENITALGRSKVEYSEPDSYLGSYTASLKTMADGTKIKTKKYPAYQFYSNMGSKIDNIAYKNMLTQEAMNVTSVLVNDNWRTTNATVTTWSNNWQYRDTLGIEPDKNLEVPVWRKHKSFIWEGVIDSQGTYGRYIDGNDFNWVDVDAQVNTEWKNISEVTRYTHFSAPIETKDLNNNFSSSKLADNWSKVIASGNAKYTEMYSSGVEYIAMNNSLVVKTEDEFTFENATLSSVAHTGKNGIKIEGNTKAFRLSGDVGINHLDDTKSLGQASIKYPFGYTMQHKELSLQMFS